MEPVTKNLPVIAMRGLNVFPRMNTSFDLERPISVHALERAMENGEEIFLVTQREIGVEQPEEKVEIDAGYEYLYDCVKDKKSIVFSNSREETEYVTATLRQIAARRAEDDIFYIHHGNLSAAIREEAEQKLKDEKKCVACATVTLELNGQRKVVTSVGNGRLDAVANAIQSATGMEFHLETYSEHSLDEGSTSRAASYVGLEWGDGIVTWGAGTDLSLIHI